jgi:hypothetical protein
VKRIGVEDVLGAGGTHGAEDAGSAILQKSGGSAYVRTCDEDVIDDHVVERPIERPAIPQAKGAVKLLGIPRSA